jgi:hypothetical protein
MYECFVTFLDAIVTPGDYQNLLLDDETWNWDRETVAKEQGLKSSLSSFQSIAVFIITKNILDEVKPLASKFQKRDQGIAEAYKRAIAIPLLDSLLQQMMDRFSEDQRHVMQLLHLVPTVITSSQESPDNVLQGLLRWEGDLPLPKSLGNELRRWNVLWHGKNSELDDSQSHISTLPDNLLLALGACDKDSYPNIHRLLVIACTLPISSAEAEQSFSLFKRIKTYLRFTMSSERLSDLSVIAMHYGERVPVDEVCQAFVKEYPRRLFDSTLFQ